MYVSLKDLCGHVIIDPITLWCQQYARNYFWLSVWEGVSWMIRPWRVALKCNIHGEAPRVFLYETAFCLIFETFFRFAVRPFALPSSFQFYLLCFDFPLTLLFLELPERERAIIGLSSTIFTTSEDCFPLYTRRLKLNFLRGLSAPLSHLARDVIWL